MKILSIHADHIEFAATKKALKSAEEADKKPVKVDECLVIFTAVEKSDESGIELISQRLRDEIASIAEQVKAKKVVLYPYAHLSSNLAGPDKAVQVLKTTEELLKKEFEVYRAPFGWYKAFEIKAKGHPLSELSREFSVDKESEKLEVSEAVKKEETLKSFWYIMDEKGVLHKISQENNKVKGFDFKKQKNLEKFSSYEIAKVRAVKGEPPHVRFMRKLELVDYEEGSDPGNLRYYPKGRLIKSLLETFVTDKVIEYGGMEIESPIMYDYEHPSLKSYLNRFPARQYTIQTPNKKTFLRFAACFGQFLMSKDATISYKNLPLRMYEMSRYSFRVEQRGELAGLRRLRAFTMPDCHALCRDMEQAKKEYFKRLELSKDIITKIGFSLDDFELGLRITKDFYEKEKKFIEELAKKWGKPLLLEMWNEKFFYFILKYEFNFVDANSKATALTTDQIDVENGERYNMAFVDKDGKKKFPLVLHLSPSGAIERVMFALLEKAYLEQQKGKPATLPLWLSPTQIRIIPVSNSSHQKFCEKLSKQFEDQNIRVDIDDNDESIGKRIRNAEKEWTPYILVVGDKECSGEKLTVRIRETGKQEKLSAEELIKQIKTTVKEMPFKKLPLPKYLSKRPIFVG